MDDAWGQLGLALGDVTTAEEAIKVGLLGDWDVRAAPLYAALPPDRKGVSRTVEVLERVAVVRDNPRIAGQVDHIGIVSPSYQIIQNEEQIPLLDAIADESGATFRIAGELENGRKAFVTAQLPGHLLVGEHHLTCDLATVKSHDGTKPFTVLVTPILDGVVLASHPVMQVRHSSGAARTIEQQARELLDKTFTYLDGFHSLGEQLVDSPMSTAKFEAVIERAYGNDESRTAASKADGKLAQMFDLYTGQNAWDGFTALARWFDYHSPVRGDTNRAAKAVLDAGFKDRALTMMESVS